MPGAWARSPRPALPPIPAPPAPGPGPAPLCSVPPPHCRAPPCPASDPRSPKSLRPSLRPPLQPRPRPTDSRSRPASSHPEAPASPLSRPARQPPVPQPSPVPPSNSCAASLSLSSPTRSRWGLGPAGEGARDPFLKGRWRGLSGGVELEGPRGGPRADPELLQTCPIESRITPRISYPRPRTPHLLRLPRALSRGTHPPNLLPNGAPGALHP
ncbi:uncharacterized protein [Eschrichtius robustus]|uniref:uncharacterized protein n=1 Tax=Eschrichtius robustus TaxID=9764 RepID=UPI0035C20B96